MTKDNGKAGDVASCEDFLEAYKIVVYSVFWRQGKIHLYVDGALL